MPTALDRHPPLDLLYSYENQAGWRSSAGELVRRALAENHGVFTARKYAG